MAASGNPTSTYKSFLMKGTGTTSITYSKLVDIKDYPDMGGEPEMLQTTTLSNKMHTYVEGIQDTGSLSFTANYVKDDYDTIAALAGQTLDLALWLGGTESNGELTPTGDDGKFSFKGTISVFLIGKGVNEVREMQITVTPSTEITVS